MSAKKPLRSRKAAHGKNGQATGDGSGSRCQDCGKLAFSTRKSASRAVARMWPGQRMRFYRCGPWWHFTAQDAATVTRYREADAVRKA